MGFYFWNDFYIWKSMDENTILNDHYELKVLLLEHDREELQKKTDEADANAKLYQEFLQKICVILSNRLGRFIDPDIYFTDAIPEEMRCEALDEAMGRSENLIRTIHHEVLPFSLVKKQPQLKEYIPIQKMVSVLQLLNDRSSYRATELIKEYNSENTKKAYMSDLVYWQAWLSAIGFSFNEPISEKEILSFIIQHAEGLDHNIDEKLVNQRFKAKLGPHKMATIKRRVISLSVFTESVQWPNHCHTKQIKLVLQKLSKKYGGSKPAGKAITRDILDDMIDACGNKLLDIRDRALLLFAWGSGGRRRDEVVSADMKDLIKNADGDYIYIIPKSKTDQEGNGTPVPVKGRVAKALKEWLTISGVTDGPIFRAVGKGGNIRGGLSAVDVYRIVKRRLNQAGYDETQFGAHSLRSGFVTEAGRRGKQLGDVMQMTTHKNVATCMKYYQSGNIINNSASNLAD
jgi:integrase